MPGSVVCDPEIQTRLVTKDLDFAFLACDGVFDVLSNEDINEIIWETVHSFQQDLERKDNKNGANETEQLSQCLKLAVDNVLKRSLIEKTEDNITAIIVVFRNILKARD